MNTKTPREIIIIDDLPPETVAMLQALYSRSPRSVKEHTTKIKEGGAEKFMGTFYVGYGHKSIGDCGTASIFIENVSMLVAKAIQDTPLYNGQEASTRYLDMNGQEVLNPLQTPEGQEIQDEWMQMYEKTLAVLIPYLTDKYPKQEEEDEKIYTKSIKAKAFDIARGLLPAGVTTYVSWHTNLRQAADHIKVLKHHPLKEVRDVATEILNSLKQKYSSSFSHKEYEKDEEYVENSQKQLAYFDLPEVKTFQTKNRLDKEELANYTELLKTRPAKTELPKRLRECGDMVFTFPLDFGSFRDIQRQRSAIIPMPLLGTHHGFFSWYLEQLPDSLREEIEARIKKQEAKIKSLTCDDVTKQYYTAMGYTIACKVVANLPSAVYIAELRSGQSVHPTLRIPAQQMTTAILENVPGIVMHSDMDPDEWTIKRGQQDIVKK